MIKKTLLSLLMAASIAACPGDRFEKNDEDLLLSRVKPDIMEGVVNVMFVDELPYDYCGLYIPPGFVVVARNSKEVCDETMDVVLCHELGHHQYFKLKPETREVMNLYGIGNESFAEGYEMRSEMCYED